MKRLITSLLFAAASLFAEGYTTYNGIYVQTSEQSSTSHFNDIIQNIDLEHTVESIVIHWDKWGMCRGPLYNIPGFEMCFDEPIGIADWSVAPGNIHSLGVSIGNNPAKQGWSRFDGEEGLNKFGYVNFIYFPVFGYMIDADGICLEKGDLTIPYLSAFDPSYDGVFASNIFKEITYMFNMTAILLGAADCFAASTANLSSAFEATQKANDDIRMSLPHYVGCWNTFPMGGWSHNPDPILQAATSSTYALAMLMRAGVLQKTARVTGYDGGVLPDTMCGPKETPVFVKPQWLYNLAYPKPSDVIPLGATAPEWAEFKNSSKSMDDVSFWVHQRKCFWFGAASCSRDKGK